MNKHEIKLLLENHIPSFLERNHDKYKELEKLRNKFVKNYSIDIILNLEIDEYIMGKGSKESFCYRIERELDPLGRILGARADKFGIYFGKVKSDPIEKYRITQRFGDNIEESFKILKNEIVNVIIAGRNDDFDSIQKSAISPMFLGKLLFIYYPTKYINIFSEDYLKFFMTELNIEYVSTKNTDLQRILIEYLNSLNISGIDLVYPFTDFLYYQFGTPKNPIIELDGKDDGEPKLNKIPLKDVKGVFIDELPTSIKQITFNKKTKKSSGKKIDFSLKNKIAKWRGTRGEKVVKKAEEKYLINVGRSDLADKLEYLADDNAAHDYDILSHTKDGIEKHIEVKSTSTKNGEQGFYISSTELKRGKEDKYFYIYLVFEVDSASPKIYKIKKPFTGSREYFALEPVTYKMFLK